MRKLLREPLSGPSLAFLDKRARQVTSAPVPKKEAERLWEARDNAAFREIRATLEVMASGLARCMYCEDSAGTDIEHFRPKARYPDLAFCWTNYLLACTSCNSNYKRTRFPLDAQGAPLLIDPTVDDPREHLILSVRTGKYVHRTPKGEKSIDTFGLGRDILEKGRQGAWHTIEALLLHYGKACSDKNWRRAIELQRTLCRHPFASIFVWLTSIAEGPQPERFIDPHCLEVLRRYPDIQHWL